MNNSDKAKVAIEALQFGDFKHCKICDYSVKPKLKYSERKHFDSYRIVCTRCKYSTESKGTFNQALETWNLN